MSSNSHVGTQQTKLINYLAFTDNFHLHHHRATLFHPVARIVDGRDCNLARASKIVIAPYLSVVCYETLIVVLTIIKAVEHIPASQLVKAADWTWVHQFYHRGVIFFILTLCVSIVNVVYPFVASPGMRSLFTDVQRAMHSMLCTRVVFVICSLQRRDEHDRARTEARKERKRNRNKIRKKSHCKFNSSSTSSAGNPGFVSPFSNHKRRDPCSDSDSDLVYNPEYDIDLDYGYNLDCNRDDEDYYHKNKRGEMAYEDGEDGNRHTNSNWRGWQESTTGVITSMLDTYVTNEDAYGPYAVYDEDRERHGGFESGSGGVEVGESGGQESSGSSGSALRRSQSRSRS
ncbi:hypothetical protein D9619_008861 [Psilocybe cf. subviscida]|uniref:Uncharacterized protein n=1 Tax=Psilocybe cf. subviscida TaxID=2480587 RepID=A0A8H5BBM5_9AGAR|nr:hypothetical protein D9619_008861 [Psilocybe cf. subviscida]